MKKRGVILSVYIYVLLIFFLLVLASLLVVLGNTKRLGKKIKDSTERAVDSSGYGFSIELKGDKTVCVPFGTQYEEPGYSSKDSEGNNLTVTIDSNLDIWKEGEYETKYIVRHISKEKFVTRKIIVYKPDFKYTGDYQEFNVPCSGYYSLETWGASGGGSGAGKGAYAKGEIYLEAGTKLYIFVGEQGIEGTKGNNATQSIGQGASATFNGGGKGGNAGGGPTHLYQSYIGGNSGGGATDIRLLINQTGSFSNVMSLRSRIIVAGGAGGGTSSKDDQKGSGGILYGDWGSCASGVPNKYISKRGEGATQTSGNNLGIGETGSNTGVSSACHGHSGGGGGYYGGYGANHTSGSCYKMGGGGGSSFVSGCNGCDSIDINGNNTGQPVHFSGLKFDNIIMISGNEKMMGPDGNITTGHSGNGYARIKYIGNNHENDPKEYEMKKFIAVPRNNGIAVKVLNPDKASNVMIRYKTTPWEINDSTTSGSLLTSNLTSNYADNTWYNNTTLTNGTTYYLKAFPNINGSYKYIYKLNEVEVKAGGLYAEYLLNGNTDETSGNSRDIVVENGVAYNNSNIGIGGKFNGSSSYITVPFILESGVMSTSMWINMSGGNKINSIYSIAQNGGYQLEVNTDNKITMKVSFDGYKNTIGPVVELNKWIHVVFIVDFTDKWVKIYYNGNLQKLVQYEDDYIPTALTGNDIISCIGCNPQPGGGPISGQHFNGMINQVRIYNRELSKSEVNSLYLEG